MNNQHYQPTTGEKCHCKPGIQRDNCPDCEGTGEQIDFAAIRNRGNQRKHTPGQERAHPRSTSVNRTGLRHNLGWAFKTYEHPLTLQSNQTH